MRSTIDISKDLRLVDFDNEGEQYRDVFVVLLMQKLCMGEHSALHLFHHEPDALVRVCIGPSAEGKSWWEEFIPLCRNLGLLVIDCFRGVLHPNGGGGEVIGELVLVQVDRQVSVSVYSPHGWDIRFYRGDRRPPCLPYRLVFSDASL